ncbi:MAG: hypothetical protein ISR69_01445 [Gammaproteobacteria bacterium]|nr:hypothetical protein [Gammaproteobacteria bacterium]
MKKIELRVLADDIKTAANELADIGVLHLVKNNDNELPDFMDNKFRRVFSRAFSRLNKVLPFVQGELLSAQHQQKNNEENYASMDELLQADKQLKDIWGLISNIEEKSRALNEKRKYLLQQASSLEKFLDLDLDLARLGRQQQFLSLQVGFVPAANSHDLIRALSLAHFVAKMFYSSEDNNYLIVAGPAEFDADMRHLLKAAEFRETPVPPEFKDHPEKIREDIEDNILIINSKLEELTDDLNEVIVNNLADIEQINELILKASSYFQVSGYLRGKRFFISLEGWIPEASESVVSLRLKQQLKHSFQMSVRDPTVEELPDVPSMPRHHKIMKPFQALVKNYGLPRYGEIDPTGMFAISYVFLFGVMFGDIGHGLSLILIGWLLRKKLDGLLLIATLLGSSSIVFGFVFGSIFGYEELIHPLWQSPMHAPVQMLLYALIFGVAFIVIAFVLSVRNLLYFQNYKAALLGSKGLSGLLFYIAGLNVTYQLFVHSDVSMLEILLMIAPLSLLLLYKWTELEGALLERILVVFIEGIEAVINSISGTLSFLRVAAFSLNHVALATAVFTMAAMMDVTGHWITVVLGNIFIIVLEGGIVAIQCLRLEYYEGFSRFFSGEGKTYKPLISKIQKEF